MPVATYTGSDRFDLSEAMSNAQSHLMGSEIIYRLTIKKSPKFMSMAVQTRFFLVKVIFSLFLSISLRINSVTGKPIIKKNRNTRIISTMKPNK